ncbi:hypothetical protein LCGC14_2345630 [marine sediment metagenome]|uniref:Uncharacterized protein n=1 Tax=marine sediment metagenome TaxID=412755 RepID=A0A0F9CAL8_9ZZZZ
MAHTGLFASSAECIAKAGNFYDSTNVDEAMINDFCLQAENLINCSTKHNWSDYFTAPATTTTLSADVWHMLGEVESNLVGIYMIESNMFGLAATGYPSRIVAEDMINILRDAALRGMSILRDKATQKFMQETTI